MAGNSGGSRGCWEFNTKVALVSRRIKWWVSLAIVLSVSSIANASQGVWATGGPYGGSINALAIDPTTPGRLYAGTNYGVFRSTNSGASWTAASTAAAPYVGVVTFVNTLAVDPTTPGTLYAGTDYGVFRSTDAGTTWSIVIDPLFEVWVYAVALAPTTPPILYVATQYLDGDGLLRIGDCGSGAATNPLPRGGSPIYALAIDPTTASTVYGIAGEVFRSTDCGHTWSVSADLPHVNTLAIDPTTPATLYAGTDGGVFRSTDTGGSWSAISTGLTSSSVTALAIDPATPATLYAGTNGGGVFTSANSGGTWVPINTGLPSLGIRGLALDPSGATTLYAGLVEGNVWQLRGSTNFYTVTPCRVLDTRDAVVGEPVALAAGSTTSVPIGGHCDVPSTATAAAINVTTTEASGPGYLTFFADGAPQPFVSGINYSVGQTRANSAVATLGSAGALGVFVGQTSGTVHVIIDVSGYFQ
jgi:photosystem II stability/assembly factor-like uncharacterized protein